MQSIPMHNCKHAKYYLVAFVILLQLNTVSGHIIGTHKLFIISCTTRSISWQL